jgi:coenzyme F420 hydrogenase subunit delta
MEELVFMQDVQDPEDIDNNKFYLDMDKLIFGCGNILFGDDAFGPAVIDHFNQNYILPKDTLAINVETSIRGLLFNIVLKEEKPKLILIVDAVDKNKKPGDIFEIDLDDIPKKKVDDFSMHQMPSSNLLKELRDEANVPVRILVAQVKYIPEEVDQVLSAEMQNTIQPMCDKIIGVLSEYDVNVKPRTI